VFEGVVPELEADIAGLRKNLLDPNALLELGATPNGMIAGYLMAEKLHLRYHDRVVLVTKNGEEFTATLVGLFASGFNAKDEREAILNLALAQRMEGIASSSVSGIGLRTERVERAAKTAALVQSATGYKSESWDETNRNVIDFLQPQCCHNAGACRVCVRGCGPWGFFSHDDGGAAEG